jgi:hypothetical protein
MNRTLEAQHLSVLYPQCPGLWPHVWSQRDCAICEKERQEKQRAFEALVLRRSRLRWWQKLTRLLWRK